MQVRPSGAILAAMLWATVVVVGQENGGGTDKPLPERVLVKEVTVGAPVAKVWEAWTTPTGIASFFAPDAKIELRPGGAFELYIVPSAPAGQRGAEGCTVLAYVPERVLAFTWNAPPSIPKLREAEARTQVVLEFTSLGPQRTKVRLSQHGFGEGEDWEKYYGYFDRAWGNVLQSLANTLGKSMDGRKRHWVYYVRPVREEFFTSPTEHEQQTVSAHAQYIADLTERGVVVLAGPSFAPSYDPRGEHAVTLEQAPPGIVVFEAADEEAARGIMDADPAVAAGVFKARLNPFVLSFQRNERQ